MILLLNYIHLFQFRLHSCIVAAMPCSKKLLSLNFDLRFSLYVPPMHMWLSQIVHKREY